MRSEVFFMVDHKREEAVWKRVMELSQQAPDCCKPKEHATLTAQQVMELLAAELQSACTYEALAGRVRGTARQKLLMLSYSERAHYARLETVYYLMTGKKPCPDRPKRPCIACTNEELRSRYMQEVKGAEQYCALAKKAGSFAHVFHELAAQEEDHAHTILLVLQQCL